MTSGRCISAASSRCPTISPRRWRFATTAISSACTIRRSATAAASSSHSFATIADRLLDLGTKGSGQTPYSRHADGRLTLKGGVREVLATEMLEALGVNTSKSFALFETGEALERGDEPSPTRSSVLTRLSHGHIRIGTFQRLAFFGEVENIKRLVRYCLENLYRRGRPADDGENALRLFDLVSQATATLAASYLAAGFVHGVLNSDNINITGESFDYGPWRFTPDWDPELHRSLFRPLRTLLLRPAAGGDPLGPRATGWLPVARRRGAGRCPTCWRAGATASKTRSSPRCSRRLGRGAPDEMTANLPLH